MNSILLYLSCFLLFNNSLFANKNEMDLLNMQKCPKGTIPLITYLNNNKNLPVANCIPEEKQKKETEVSNNSFVLPLVFAGATATIAGTYARHLYNSKRKKNKEKAVRKTYGKSAPKEQDKIETKTDGMDFSELNPDHPEKPLTTEPMPASLKPTQVPPERKVHPAAEKVNSAAEKAIDPIIISRTARFVTAYRELLNARAKRTLSDYDNILKRMSEEPEFATNDLFWNDPILSKIREVRPLLGERTTFLDLLSVLPSPYHSESSVLEGVSFLSYLLDQIRNLPESEAKCDIQKMLYLKLAIRVSKLNNDVAAIPKLETIFLQYMQDKPKKPESAIAWINFFTKIINSIETIKKGLARVVLSLPVNNQTIDQKILVEQILETLSPAERAKMYDLLMEYEHYNSEKIYVPKRFLGVSAALLVAYDDAIKIADPVRAFKARAAYEAQINAESCTRQKQQTTQRIVEILL